MALLKQNGVTYSLVTDDIPRPMTVNIFEWEKISTNITNQLQRLSDERAIELLPVIVLIGCMMVAGIIGNSLIVYVFLRKFKKTTQTTLFIALACFDLITCTVAMPFEILDLRFFYNFNWNLACKLSRSMVTFPTLASNQILLLIAVDRFRKVCCPLKTQISPGLAQKLIIVVVILSCLLTVPAYLLYGLRSAITSIPGLIGSDCATGDDVKDTIYPVIYGYVLTFFFVLFVVTLAFLYTLIWRAARRLAFASGNIYSREQSTNLLNSSSSNSAPKADNRQRPRLVMLMKTDSVCKKARHVSTDSCESPSIIKLNIQSSSPSLNSKATGIAFAVTFVFIVSFIPHLVLNYMKNINKDFDYRLRGAQLVAFNIFLRSFLVNSVINPIIYAAMNPTFRRECVRIFHCIYCCLCYKTEKQQTPQGLL